MVGPVTIPKDDVFHVLQSGRRRAVMRYLLEHSGDDRFTHGDIVDEVAAWEADTTVRQLSTDQRQRMYIALYQTHLPTLDKYDVIDYDRERGTVEPTPLLAVFEPYLGDGLHEANEHLSSSVGEGGSETAGLTNAVTALFSK